MSALLCDEFEVHDLHSSAVDEKVVELDTIMAYRVFAKPRNFGSANSVGYLTSVWETTSCSSMWHLESKLFGNATNAVADWVASSSSGCIFWHVGQNAVDLGIFISLKSIV